MNTRIRLRPLVLLSILAWAIAPAFAEEGDAAALIEKLKTKVDAKGAGDLRYSQEMHEQLAAWLPHLDPADRADAELLANAREFAGGKLSGQVFAVYFRETHLRPMKRRLRMLKFTAKGDGVADSILATAVMHQTGDGVPLDLKQGAQLLTKAAEAGSIAAMNRLADQYRMGHGGFARDDASAVKWYRKAADRSPWAMLMLGEMIDGGRGADADKAEAKRLFEDARKAAKVSAEAGSAEGMYVLGYLLIDDGDKGLPKDYAAALSWYRKAAELKHPAALNTLGYLYFNGYGVEKDPAAAIEWWRKAAAAENIDGIQWLARAYRDGIGVPRDYAKSMEWYLYGSERGSAFAMNEVGYLHDAGLGVPSNYEEAMTWYRKAAALNHAKGTANVGALFEFGKGRPRDPQEALKWWRKGAELGDLEGMYHTGRLLSTGEAGEKDEAAAWTWMQRAAKAGHVQAKVWLKLRGHVE